MTQHCMIDLETLGTSSTAAIVQLGAVKFDPTGAEPLDHGATFERTVTIESNLRLGRTVDGPTIAWWLGQSAEARRAITEDAVNLGKALNEFRSWLLDGAQTEIVIWSHGAAFDVPILESAWRACRRAPVPLADGFLSEIPEPPPWDYRAARDTRTLFWIAETLAGWQKPVRETAHTALADAIAQAEDVRSAYAAIA